VNDPVDRLLAEREQMDRGFQASVVISVAAHLVLLGTTVAAAIFGSKPPVLQVQDGFAVPLPPGGGGMRSTAPPAPAVTTPAQPEPEKDVPPPTVAPPPKIVKPPKDEPKQGLPELDAKKSKVKATPAPAPRSGGVAGGTGTAAQTPGLEFGPPGPGVPGGTDMLGDWYLAGVQRKIWMLWTQQIRPSAPQPVTISFTITADGSVTDIRVVQSSGIYLLDNAAQRAVFSAGPFGSLPKNYGTDRYTIQAIFKPSS
jgi:protein TonB